LRTHLVVSQECVVRTFYISVLLLGTTVAWGAASNPDASFYTDLAEGGMAEVDAANLAQQNSTDPEVKRFASKMIKDHTAANAELKALAEKKGIKLPESASVAQKAEYAKLKL